VYCCLSALLTSSSSSTTTSTTTSNAACDNSNQWILNILTSKYTEKYWYWEFICLL
jgi:hypothetical protein